METIAAAANAVEAWRAAVWLRESLWGYPLVSVLHLLGIAWLLGGIAIVDARVLGLAASAPMAAVARSAWPVAVTGLVLALGTGPWLFITRSSEYIVNPAFLWKLALLAGALLNVAAFHALGRGVLDGRRAPGTAVRASAAASLLLWLGVLAAGRWIAFV